MVFAHWSNKMQKINMYLVAILISFLAQTTKAQQSNPADSLEKDITTKTATLNQQVKNKMGRVGPKQFIQLYQIEKALIDSKTITDLPLNSFKRLFLFYKQGLAGHSRKHTECLWKLVENTMQKQNAEVVSLATYMIATGANDFSQMKLDQSIATKSKTDKAYILINSYMSRHSECSE